MSSHTECVCIAVAFLVFTMCSLSCPTEYKPRCTEYLKNCFNCSYMKLSSIPTTLPNSTEVLDLSHNRISRLKSGQFSRFTSLRWLNISHNMLTSIDRADFDGVKNLDCLDLSSNNIKGLDSSGLAIARLSYLFLHNNSYENYTTLHLDQFPCLKTLSIDVFENFRFSFNLSLTKLQTIMFNPRPNKWFFLLNDSFSGFAHSPIESLNLDFYHCVRRQVATYYLRPFQHLKHLRIHFGFYCSIKDVLRSLAGLSGRTIDTLDLRNNYLASGAVQYLTDKDLEALSTMCVRKLDLSRNSIARIFSVSIWNSSISKCLEELNLEGNDFVKNHYLPILPLANFERIRTIKISFFLPPDQKVFSQSPNYRVERNDSIVKTVFKQRDLYNITFYASPTLQTFNCNNVLTNFGGYFRSWNAKFIATGVKSLSAAYTHLTFCNIRKPHYFQIKGKLEYLDMSGWDCSGLNPNFLADTVGFLTLRTLKAVHSQLKDGFEKDKNGEFLKGLLSLEYVDFSDNELSQLHWNLFGDQRSSIKTVILSKNNFQCIPETVLAIRNLQHLDVSRNAIVSLSEDNMLAFDSWTNVSIDLTYNSFGCSCFNLAMLKWMSKKKHKLTNIPHIKCRETESMQNILNNINVYEINCSSKVWLRISIIIFIFLTASVFGSALGYKYRYNILFIYMRARRYIKCETSSGHKYHVFISYNPENEAGSIWTKQELRSFLTADMQLDVAFEEQDFSPGINYLHCLHTCMEDSRRIIIVYDENFLDFFWSQSHLELATIQSLQQPGLSLIIIVRDQTRKQDLPLPLQRVWWKLNFIYWPSENSEAELRTLFWQHLRAALMQE